MSDIKLFMGETINDGIAPRIVDNDFAPDEGFETAVIISLFTDARIIEEQLPQGQTNRRGWWGDLFSVAADKIGSRFWLLTREKKTTEVLRRYEDYTREALNWMIEDGIAKTVTAVASYSLQAPRPLLLDIMIIKADGVSLKYQVNWEKQTLRSL